MRVDFPALCSPRIMPRRSWRLALNSSGAGDGATGGSPVGDSGVVLVTGDILGVFETLIMSVDGASGKSISSAEEEVVIFLGYPPFVVNATPKEYPSLHSLGTAEVSS